MVEADRGHVLPNDKHVPLVSHQDVTTVTSPI